MKFITHKVLWHEAPHWFDAGWTPYRLEKVMSVKYPVVHIEWLHERAPIEISMTVVLP